MDENTVFQRTDNATFQVVAGEAIVIRMDTGAYYSLNQVGTDFWEGLDGRTPLHQHAQTIADKYNRETADFITQLRQLAQADGDVSHQAQQLADEYDVDVTLVTDNLSSLAGPDADAHAAALAQEFAVTPEVVTADLLELAAELLMERLVEEVSVQ